MEKHDDFSQVPVPQEARRGFWSMSVVMLGYTFFAASMWVGGTLGLGFRLFPDLVIVILAGNVILGLYGGLLGYASSSTGLSTHMLARRAFGRSGAALPSLLLALTQIGWFGVGVSMFAYAVNKLTGIPLFPLIAVGGFMMTLTVVIGFSALEWISRLAVPAILILGLWSMGRAVGDFGGLAALAAVEPQNPLTFSTGVALGVGSFISGATLTPDFIRFAKSRKEGVSATVMGFAVGNSLMFFFGALGAVATGLSDTAEVLAAQGLLGAGIALLTLNIWTTNDNALYASGLGLASISGMSRRMATIIGGLVGTLLADFLYNNFVGWLNFLSIFIPAIGGILISDFLLDAGKSKSDFMKGLTIRKVNWAAMAAWPPAVAVSMLSPAEGPLCVAPLNSIVVAAAVYVIMKKYVLK
ncbi:cytosine permease [Deltaproteobacteria bacterium Smac51]|nr:cytosine permease [Deltaproteobacteria bacterium Smac51]